MLFRAAMSVLSILFHVSCCLMMALIDSCFRAKSCFTHRIQQATVCLQLKRFQTCVNSYFSFYLCIFVVYRKEY